MATLQRNTPLVSPHRAMSDEVKSIIGKLQKDPDNLWTNRNNMRLPDSRMFGLIANKTIQNVADNRNLFQVLPDMDYARQILISAIISPADLTSSDLIYSLEKEGVDGALLTPILGAIKKYFNETYRITTLLPKILNDVLFEKGSYPLLVIPESSIDEVINGPGPTRTTMESHTNALNGYLHENYDTANQLYRGLGALGPSKAVAGQVYTSFESVAVEASKPVNAVVSMEAAKDIALTDQDKDNVVRHSAALGVKMFNDLTKSHESIVVTDNYLVLKHPSIQEAKRRLAHQRIYGAHRKNTARTVSNEDTAQKVPTLNEVESKFYSTKKINHVPIQVLKTKTQIGKPTVGHPLVMVLPPESVFTIHSPGDPTNHVAYMVMLELNGGPLNVTSRDNYHEDIRNQLNTDNKVSSSIISQARRGMEGFDPYNYEVINEMTRLYGEAVETDLKARLRNGMVGDGYEISRPENINQLMFSRHLKGQRTLMLYVPKEMMTYIAFDYNEYGIGKSLLEDGKILGALRTAVTLANVLTALNNASSGKTINITLDERDENPAETVEFMLSEHQRVNGEGFPRLLGQTHPLGVADLIQNHGVNVVVEGNTRYPSTKFDVQGREGTGRMIDPELTQDLHRKHYQMFGLSPEMAEGINTTDFATTVVQNSLMLLKRVIHYQEQLEPFLNDFIRNYVLNSGTLLEELLEILKTNKGKLPAEFKEEDKWEAFLYEIIDAVTVAMPSPETGDIEKQMASYTKYAQAVDDAFDVYINSEMFITETDGIYTEIIPQIKVVVTSRFKRDWLRKHGVLPELDIFNRTDSEDTPAIDFMVDQNEHMDGLKSSIGKYIEAVIKAAEKRKAEVEKLQAEKDKIGGSITGEEGGGDGLPDESGDDLLDDSLPEDPVPDEPELDLDEETPPEEEEEETPPDEEEPEADPDASAEGGDAIDIPAT